MKISFWNRVVLIMRLMFFMSVSKMLRLLFAREVQPLNDENRENRAQLRRNKETIESQSLKLHDHMNKIISQEAEIEALKQQMKSAGLQYKDDLGDLSKRYSATASKNASLEIEVERLKVDVSSLNARLADDAQKHKVEVESLQRNHQEDVTSMQEQHRIEINLEKQNTEAVLQDVLFELRGKGGEDNRYDDTKAGEYCKNLTINSCRSLRHIKKIQTRLEECEQRIHTHFAARDQAEIMAADALDLPEE